MEEAKREYAAARERGDFDVAGVIAGEACALIHDLPPAGEIVERIVAEADRLLRSALLRFRSTAKGHTNALPDSS
jgi:hypothetical protein